MVRDIVLWPDPVLREAAAEVSKIDEGVRALVADMLDTLNATENGIGLAAPQIGVARRVVVIDLNAREPDSDPMVLINPRILRTEGTRTGEESCLSIPGEYGEVARADKVWVEATDLMGKRYEIAGEELLAIALQHELDHLDGTMFVDHLSALKRETIKRRMKRLKAEGARAAKSSAAR